MGAKIRLAVNKFVKTNNLLSKSYFANDGLKDRQRSATH